MIAKDHFTIGIEWWLGPKWQGQRCGAKTRRGTPCQRLANKLTAHRRLHGGASLGPRTQQGRAKIAPANTINGQHTKAMIARRKEDAKIAKGFRDRLRLIA